jgi:hypothetical protein
MCREWSPLLGGALPAYETFLTSWQQMERSTARPQLRPFIHEGHFWAKGYHGRLRANKTYLFAMCKLSLCVLQSRG